MPLSRCLVTMNYAKHTHTAWNSPGSPMGWSQNPGSNTCLGSSVEGHSPKNHPEAETANWLPSVLIWTFFLKGSWVSPATKTPRCLLLDDRCPRQLAGPHHEVRGLGSSNTFLQRECVHSCLFDLKQGRRFVSLRFSSHNIASPYTCPVPDPWIPWPVGLVQVRYAPHQLALGSLALQALWSSCWFPLPTSPPA